MTEGDQPHPGVSDPQERKPVYPQSAVLPFRKAKARTEVLLVTNNSGKRWILPKGLVEEDLTPAVSALAEAYEEAGVEGRIASGCVGIYEYEKWGGICRVQVFLMHVERQLADWPEAGLRQRRWVSMREARGMVDDRIPSRLVDTLAASLP